MARSETVDIVVLGRRLGDGGEVTELFRRRLEKAVEVYREKKREGRASRIVVTGGDLGRKGLSEARAGDRFLRERGGVPPEDIVVEEKACDTIGNAVYTKLILLESGCRRPIVVSSCYHIPRASYVFSHVLGPEFEPSYVSASTGLDPGAYHRHWHSESVKMVKAVEFFDAMDAPPGDHEKVFEYLRRNGMLVEDTVE